MHRAEEFSCLKTSKACGSVSALGSKTAETYSHVEWKQGFARYEAWTELGWVIGLLLGFLLAALSLGSSTMLIISVFFSLISFVASAIFVMDPALIFERGLVSIEKSISVVQRGAINTFFGGSWATSKIAINVYRIPSINKFVVREKT